MRNKAWCSVNSLFFLGILVIVLFTVTFFINSGRQSDTYQASNVESHSINVDRPLRFGKLLFATASYDLTQFLTLWKSLDCMKDICNAGWDVDIALQVSNGMTYDHPIFQSMHNSLYCDRIGR
jgi:hypothetical protein